MCSFFSILSKGPCRHSNQNLARWSYNVLNAILIKGLAYIVNNTWLLLKCIRCHCLDFEIANGQRCRHVTKYLANVVKIIIMIVMSRQNCLQCHTPKVDMLFIFCIYEVMFELLLPKQKSVCHVTLKLTIENNATRKCNDYHNRYPDCTP